MNCTRIISCIQRNLLNLDARIRHLPQRGDGVTVVMQGTVTGNVASVWRC